MTTQAERLEAIRKRHKYMSNHGHNSSTSIDAQGDRGELLAMVDELETTIEHYDKRWTKAEAKLEAALPTLTLITDNTETWPENRQEIIYRFLYLDGSASIPYAMEWDNSEAFELIDDENECVWWPIPDGMLDPPETGK